MDKRFKHRSIKNKSGETTVLELKNGFRTLNIEGKVKVPIAVLSLLNFSIVQSFINAIGTYILGLFPFLKQGPDTSIKSFSVPTSYLNHKRPNYFDLCYDYTFTISKNAIDIPTKKILQMVSIRNEEIGDLLKEKINEELSYYLESG